MKLLLILLTLTISSVAADKEKFHKAMQNTLAQLDSAGSTHETYLQLANKFERIGTAEKEEWLPFYYAAFCYTMSNYSEQDNVKKDELLDKAQKLVDQANSLKPDDSEIHVLKGWILSARIAIDPRTRGMKYGGESSDMLERAKKLNPENPRYYYMKGNSYFYTPPMFGGSKTKAKEMYQTALQKFDSFKPESDIHPHWGRKQTEMMLKKTEE